MAAKTISLKDLAKVVFDDVDNNFKGSDKWPLVIDLTGNAGTFIRYRDVNYLEAINPHQMEKEIIRLAVMGALRYGKALVLDLQDTDLFDQCTKFFNDVQPGLMAAILDKSVMKEDVYSKLIKDSDLPEYSALNFGNAVNFMFVLLTTKPAPAESIIKANMYHIQIE